MKIVHIHVMLFVVVCHFFFALPFMRRHLLCKVCGYQRKQLIYLQWKKQLTSVNVYTDLHACVYTNENRNEKKTNLNENFAKTNEWKLDSLIHTSFKTMLCERCITVQIQLSSKRVRAQIQMPALLTQWIDSNTYACVLVEVTARSVCDTSAICKFNYWLWNQLKYLQSSSQCDSCNSKNGSCLSFTSTLHTSRSHNKIERRRNYRSLKYYKNWVCVFAHR